MTLRRHTSSAGAARGGRLWPVLCALCVAVVLPGAAMFWMMNRALQDGQLAARQRLTELYQQQLDRAVGDVEERVIGWLVGAGNWRSRASGRIVMGDALRGDLAKIAVVMMIDPGVENGFPYVPWPDPPTYRDETWIAARQAESYGSPEDAERLYDQVIRRNSSGTLTSAATLAKARLLRKSDRNEDALAVLRNRFGDPGSVRGTDHAGWDVRANALMMAIDMDADWACLQLGGIVDQLPTTQRALALRKLAQADREKQEYWSLRLQRLRAALEVCADLSPRRPGLLTPWQDGSQYWLLDSRDGRTVVILPADALQARLADIAAAVTIPGGHIRVIPSSEKSDPDAFVSVPLPSTPSLALGVFLDQDDPFAAAVAQQRKMYTWIAGLAIALSAAFAGLLARHLRRQVQLTRLKNDLIATVSHELKTPVASCRALVETILDGRCRDETQQREYLELIARENQRLCRLIDNFLTFSRMERNKKALTFERIAPAEFVRPAVESVTERFDANPDARLDVDLPDELPAVDGDGDALCTVVLNLLDNAWKYGGPSPHVRLAVRADDNDLRVDVHDNGIGMTPRQLRHAFDRFYQADRTLSGHVGGCGLGLAIVRFLVEVHGGTVSATSSPGRGSTFTVRLPTAGTQGGDDGR